jgi:hypothetical protein
MPYSGMLRGIALVRTDVSKKRRASIIKVTGISELGNLALTSNRRTLRRNAILYYTVLYYTIQYYAKLCHTILYYTILHYTILYYNILYYTVLYYTSIILQRASVASEG